MKNKLNPKEEFCNLATDRSSISIRSHVKGVRISAPPLKKILAFILEQEKKTGELSILFVNDEEISRLNEIYRKKKGPTDVLSFPCDIQGSPVPVLGDIVVSIPTAREQAERRGCSFTHEVAFLLIHGALHLIGYDHHRSSDRRKMFLKQEIYFQQYLGGKHED
jgi:probable rRNA maturation factor